MTPVERVRRALANVDAQHTAELTAAEVRTLIDQALVPDEPRDLLPGMAAMIRPYSHSMISLFYLVDDANPELGADRWWDAARARWVNWSEICALPEADGGQNITILVPQVTS